MQQRTKKIIFGILAIVIGLPLALIAIASAWFRMEGKINGTVVTSGEMRKYLLYVPKSYDRSRPTPLLISLHAAALRPQAQMEISGWNQLADQQVLLLFTLQGAKFPESGPWGCVVCRGTSNSFRI
jgi:polyhydroxybutyrate depolymerase